MCVSFAQRCEMNAKSCKRASSTHEMLCIIDWPLGRDSFTYWHETSTSQLHSEAFLIVLDVSLFARTYFFFSSFSFFSFISLNRALRQLYCFVHFMRRLMAWDTKSTRFAMQKYQNLKEINWMFLFFHVDQTEMYLYTHFNLSLNFKWIIRIENCVTRRHRAIKSQAVFVTPKIHEFTSIYEWSTAHFMDFHYSKSLNCLFLNWPKWKTQRHVSFWLVVRIALFEGKKTLKKLRCKINRVELKVENKLNLR